VAVQVGTVMEALRKRRDRVKLSLPQKTEAPLTPPPPTLEC